jgi:transposase-like protein
LAFPGCYSATGGPLSPGYSLNDQTIRNWVKQASGSQLLIEETSPRFINAQEKYLLIKEAASISEAEKGTFLRERGAENGSDKIARIEGKRFSVAFYHDRSPRAAGFFDI